MDLSTKKRLAAAAVIISGITAFVAPFLLHSPTTQGGPNTNDNNNNDEGGSQDNNNPGTPGQPGGQGGGPKKSLKDLKDKLADCADGANRGMQRALDAKVDSAMRAGNSTRTDHHLRVLQHQLETPAAERHAGSCRSELTNLINELLAA